MMNEDTTSKLIENLKGYGENLAKDDDAVYRFNRPIVGKLMLEALETIKELQTIIGHVNGAQITKLPNFNITTDTGSGLSVTAMLGEKYNCVEFTLRDDRPQPILISPWMQWEPVELAVKRQELAVEIVRRANAYETLINHIYSLQGVNKSYIFGSEEAQRKYDAICDIWMQERAECGKSATDTSDMSAEAKAIWERFSSLNEEYRKQYHKDLIAENDARSKTQTNKDDAQ